VQIMGSMASLPDLHLKEMVSAAPDAGVRAGVLLYRLLTREFPERLARERLIVLAQTSVHLTADHARLLQDPLTSRRHLTTEEFVVNLVDMLTTALFAPPTPVPTKRRVRSNAPTKPTPTKPTPAKPTPAKRTSAQAKA
jgi:hypothetical protein